MPAPPARMRSASVPCGLNSISNSPARYCRSNSLFSPTYEEIILRIWRGCSSNPSPTPSRPALFDTTRRLPAPDACSPSIRFSGIPQAPNPPHIKVMPSLTTPSSADAASGYTLAFICPSFLCLVAILIGFVRTLFLHPDIAGLGVGQLRQLRAELRELQARDFLIEMLGQHVHADRVFLGIGEELDLRQHLIRERGAHHIGRVPRAAAQVHQPALGEQNDPLAVGENHMIDLRLDIVPGILAKGG